MAILVQVPAALRQECGGAGEFSLAADSVRSALDEIERRFPGLYRSVCNETGRVRQHVNLFVNDSFVLKTDGLETPLRDGDVLFIMPAVSGG